MLRFFGFYGVNWQFDRGGVPQIFDADEWQEPVIVAFCAEDDDGILDVIVVEKLNPVSTLIALLKLPSGKGFIDGKIVKHFSGKHVVIETNQPLIDIDGELFENKKFDAKIAPNSINLIL